MPLRAGDFIPTWFSGCADGMSKVISVRPYTGRYKEFFNCVLLLTAPRTRAGCLEMSWKDEL